MIRNINVKGVGGWLAWLIIVMLVLGPFGHATQIVAAMNSTEAAHPGIATLDTWQHYKVATWINWAVAAALSFGAGILLLKWHVPQSVAYAKGALWIANPIYGVIHALVLTPLILDVPITWAYVVSLCPGFARSVMPPVIWCLYLQKSVRVRNTYNLPLIFSGKQR